MTAAQIKQDVQSIRIAGTTLPMHKRAVVGLTAIFGIGPTLSRKVLHDARIKEDIRLKDLTNEEIERIRTRISVYKVEGDLKVTIGQNIKRLKEIHTYRGLRHARNLPVRGQRTKTNARTKRGKRVTVGSGRKKASEKT